MPTCARSNFDFFFSFLLCYVQLVFFCSHVQDVGSAAAKNRAHHYRLSAKTQDVVKLDTTTRLDFMEELGHDSRDF